MSNIRYKSPGIVLWCTGLSGSGKTTVANGLSDVLTKSSITTLILDGDEIRGTQNSYLGFTEKDIKYNNRLIANMCLEKRSHYNVLLVPIISPYRQSREEARSKLSSGFFEIYFSASLSCVKNRDVKGLYTKASNNEINNLIGVSRSNPYEPPDRPDLIINTEYDTIQQSVDLVYNFVISKFSPIF